MKPTTKPASSVIWITLLSLSVRRRINDYFMLGVYIPIGCLPFPLVNIHFKMAVKLFSPQKTRVNLAVHIISPLYF
jgi:hypothetical protein